MKKSIVTIAILAACFLAGTVLTTSCTGKKGDGQEQNESEEHEHAEGDDHDHHKADSTATAYACPMHPEITGKEGDKCSKCGMKLEAVKDKKEEEHSH